MSYEMYLWLGTILIIVGVAAAFNVLLVLVGWLMPRTWISIRPGEIDALEQATSKLQSQVTTLEVTVGGHLDNDHRLEVARAALRRQYEITQEGKDAQGVKQPRVPSKSQAWSFPGEVEPPHNDPEDPYRVIPRGVGPLTP